MKMKKITILSLSLLLIINNELFAQCAQSSNIYSFTYNGHYYEIVKELKNWQLAKQCAIERGGYLIRINDLAENTYIMGQLLTSNAANISPTYNPVLDGGGASYIWTGGNDIVTEGQWIWEGSDLLTPFYIGQGTAGNGGGYAVNGAFVNWGNVNGSEPDDYPYNGGQDGLGLALNSWPHGNAGQWNDININNALYFIIEKNNTGISNNSFNDTELGFNIRNNVIIINNLPYSSYSYKIFDSKGMLVQNIENTNNNSISVASLPYGLYIININVSNNLYTFKFVK